MDARIELIPNPSKETVLVNIALPKQESFLIEICDLGGKVIRSEQYANSIVQLNRNGLKSGVYIVQLKSIDGELLSSKRLVLE